MAHVRTALPVTTAAPLSDYGLGRRMRPTPFVFRGGAGEGPFRSRVEPGLPGRASRAMPKGLFGRAIVSGLPANLTSTRVDRDIRLRRG